ncbi:MAG: hypothetical protein WBA53_12045 [Burkholderiaceae bacterium]
MKTYFCPIQSEIGRWRSQSAFLIQRLGKNRAVAQGPEIPDNVRFPKNGTVVEADRYATRVTPDRAAQLIQRAEK